MIDVSVVIPTFRREAQLLEAIGSVLDAPQVAAEVIVIDDSPEGSARASVAGLGDARITYLQQQPPSGGRPALVRNGAWPLTRGRMIHFLDDDDRVAAGFHRAALDMLDARPDCGVVFGHVAPFAAEPEQDIGWELAYFATASRRALWAARVGSRRWLTACLLFLPTLLINSACVIRRDCVAELGGYDTSLRMNEDVDFFCRAIRRYGFAFLDRTAVHYRINRRSLMHGRSDDSHLVQSYQQIHERYRQMHGSAEFLAMKLLARTALRQL